MAKLVITNASATKSFEYQNCGVYDNAVLAPSSSVEIPLSPIEWYSGTAKRAWYEALDGAQDGDISVTYDADTDVNGISFKVINAVGGANISGATITYAEGLTLTTNASGVASVADLEPGTYSITITKTGYQSYTTSIVIGTSSVVTVQCMAAMLQDDVNSIGFKVIAAVGGAAIEGATITYGEGLTATTNASGVATITELAAGTYSITVSKTGYQNYETSITIGTESDVAATCQVAMLLEEQTNSMSFHVRAAATSANLEGVTITYGEGLTLTTAANGTASVASLAAGTYNITISKENYTDFTTSVTFAAGFIGSFAVDVCLVAA